MKTYEKLSDISELIGGYAFKSDSYVNDGIRVVRITNVQDGYFSDEHPCFYPSSISSELGKANLKENDLLMSLTGNIGRVAFLPASMLPAGLNQRVECIRVKNNLLKKYLFFYFRNTAFVNEAIKNSTGVAQLNLSIKWLGDHMVPIPERKTMELIVSSLEQIDELIEKCNKELEFYDELTKSRFNEMFGDPLRNKKEFRVVPLNELTPFNSIKGKVQITDQTWLLNLDMVESNSGRIISKFRTSKVDGSTIEFDTNCVLYSKLRPYLNKVVIPDEDGFATSELISLRCNKKTIEREYLATALRHKSFVDFINSKTAGAKMPRANMDELRKFKMPVPSIQEQQKFSAFVREIDKLKFSIR